MTPPYKYFVAAININKFQFSIAGNSPPTSSFSKCCNRNKFDRPHKLCYTNPTEIA